MDLEAVSQGSMMPALLRVSEQITTQELLHLLTQVRGWMWPDSGSNALHPFQGSTLSDLRASL